MSDIFEQVDDALRQDRVQSLWRRWGWMVVLGAVLIIAGTAAVVGWRAYEQSVAEEQTQALSDAIAASADAEPDQAVAALRTFAEDADPNLAALARLRAAAHAVGNDDPETAVELYLAISADPEVDQVLRDLAAVLSAALSVDDADFDTLRGPLAALEGANNPWRHIVNEIMAAAALEAGDLDAAEERLIAISDDAAAPSDLRRRAAELLAAIDARRAAADRAEAGGGAEDNVAEEEPARDEAAPDEQPAPAEQPPTDEEADTDEGAVATDAAAADEEAAGEAGSPDAGGASDGGEEGAPADDGSEGAGEAAGDAAVGGETADGDAEAVEDATDEGAASGASGAGPDEPVAGEEILVPDAENGEAAGTEE